MLVLGINCAYHESAACLLRNGEIVAAVEEERFNRRKRAKASLVSNADELPSAAIAWCFEVASKQLGKEIDWSSIDHVGFSMLPEERFRRNTEHAHPYSPNAGDFGTVEGETDFRDRCLAVRENVSALGFGGSFHYISHHLCHAASAFHASPFEDAAVLVVDGIAEFASTTAYHGRGAALEQLWSVDYPHSLGFLWEKMAKFLGFSEYDACKVMGLASYGDPVAYAPHFARFVQTENGFRIDDGVVRFRNGSFRGLEEIFGVRKRNAPVSSYTKETEPYADIAAALQQMTEEILLDLAKRLRVETGSRCLGLAGGVALNCVANGRIAAESGFDRVFVQPASHDAGTSIGAALAIWHDRLAKPRRPVSASPYTGPAFTNEEIRDALDACEFSFEKIEDITSHVADLLADGAIVAWFQGHMEFGPRALGNRSLLADPRRESVRDILNDKVKHREPFRPFCPSVLVEKAGAWFDIEPQSGGPEYYMLRAVDAREGVRDRIPAVVHIDGTCRIQTVDRTMNPRYHELISKFEERTGVPVLLNTSFNDSEPIVCTPQNAIETFRKTRIDWLVLGDYCVSRNAREPA